MAMVSLLALSALFVQADTVRLTPAEFLDQALAAAPGVELAELQADAARSRADQARAWANPQLSLQVDNYGAEREVTNIDGLAGLEAQAVFAFPLPVGGDRGARMRLGAAGARGAEASLQLTRGDASVRAVAALAFARRDAAAFQRAQDEVETLTRLADALDRQAELERSTLQRPLATVVIGGIATSTLLTLLVLPTVYRMVERWNDRWMAQRQV